MATLAYVFPPISGIALYFVGAEARVRFHGLQAVALGLLSAASLYLGSLLSGAIVPPLFLLWIVVWFVLLVTSAFGRDVKLPLLGRWLERAAEGDPRAR